MIDENNHCQIIKGEQYSDVRGSITYFNNLDLSVVKRFYKIKHPNKEVVRAWQGHMKEQKWFYVLSGTFKVVLVRPDNWQIPSADLIYEEFVLSDLSNHILHVPGGFINGFKALAKDSEIMIFSNFTVEESSDDDFRFDKNLWYKW